MKKLTDTDIIRNVTDQELVEATKTYTSASQFILHKVGKLKNGRTQSLISSRINVLGLKWKSTSLKWPSIEKKCPTCDEEFRSETGDRRSYVQVCCSRGCANTHFMTGSDHPNYNPDNYRNICFAHHNKKCVICEEERIVAVHHYDLDHSNDAPDNLVPLCPTHHLYIHSRYVNLIQEEVDRYVSNFKEQHASKRM